MILSSLSLFRTQNVLDKKWPPHFRRFRNRSNHLFKIKSLTASFTVFQFIELVFLCLKLVLCLNIVHSAVNWFRLVCLLCSGLGGIQIALLSLSVIKLFHGTSYCVTQTSRQYRMNPSVKGL